MTDRSPALMAHPSPAYPNCPIARVRTYFGAHPYPWISARIVATECFAPRHAMPTQAQVDIAAAACRVLVKDGYLEGEGLAFRRAQGA